METLTPSARRRRATTIMAVTGLLSCGVLAMTANNQPANAAVSDTCDAALITLHKVDSETGDNITNNAAKFLVKTTGNVFLLPGDHLNLENDFREAYDGGLGANDNGSNTSGTARDNIDKAQVDNFFSTIYGSNHQVAVDAIPDISSLTTNEARSAAYASWVNNAHLVAAQTAIEDAQDAFLDMKAELDADARYIDGRLTYNQHVVDSLAEISDMLDAYEDARTGYTAAIADPSYWDEVVGGDTNWERFTDTLSTITTWYEDDGDAVGGYQWTTVDMDPSDEETDLYYWRHGGAAAAGKAITDPVDYSATINKDASEAGADAIDAVQQAEISTNAAGDLQFTVFGVKDSAYYGGTRGDDTCSQLVATAVETMAPDGYVLDGVTVNMSATNTQTGEVSVSNTKRGTTTDIPHFYYRTGL